MNPLLPSQNRRLRELAAFEAEHGIRWTDVIDSRARILILGAFNKSYTATNDPWSPDDIHDAISDYVCTHAETYPVAASWVSATAGDDQWESVGTDEYLDWLQAASILLDRFSSRNGAMSGDHEYAYPLEYDGHAFRDRVNDILLDRRVNFTFVGDALVDRDSQPLHASVVAPVTATLSSDSRFSAAESAYNEALSHLAGHHAGASITAAGTAVQETLRALGAQGQSLGALFADARARGFLFGHDENLVAAYSKLGAWITADRSNRGNAHWATTGDVDDALLACQICGALVLRLIAASGQAETRAG